MNAATRQFILDHRTDDVRRLALKGAPEGVDLTWALQQVSGWQKASRKLPAWAAVEGLWYPPHLNLEQCSSEQTARYKQQLLDRKCADKDSLVDLTGGFGVDFAWMSRPFRRRVYVEQQEALCQLAAHNLPLLGLEAEVVCTAAADYLGQMAPASVVYADPARRDDHGARTYGIADCTPDVLALLPLLLAKSALLLLKLSPMLDWRKAVSDLGSVSEVHIVSVGNECKELLLVLEREAPADGGRLFCANDDTLLAVPFGGTYRPAACPVARALPTDAFLYEPNASVMKAGCFGELAVSYHVEALHPQSHLFVSADRQDHFPGRRFRVLSVTTLNRRALRTALAGIAQANVAVRNFPLSAEALRQRLGVRDGGDCYIFGTTVADGTHQLLICRKDS